MKDWLDEDLITFLFAGVFAMICGGLSYMLKVIEGKVFKWGEFVIYVAISGVAGLICFRVLEYAGMPANLNGMLCGIAGWMGTRAFKLFELVLKMKLGVKAEQLDSNNDTSAEE